MTIGRLEISRRFICLKLYRSWILLSKTRVVTDEAWIGIPSTAPQVGYMGWEHQKSLATKCQTYEGKESQDKTRGRNSQNQYPLGWNEGDCRCLEIPCEGSQELVYGPNWNCYRCESFWNALIGAITLPDTSQVATIWFHLLVAKQIDVGGPEKSH